MFSRTLPSWALLLIALAVALSGCNKAKELAGDAKKKISKSASSVGKEIKKGASQVNKELKKGVSNLKDDVKDITDNATNTVNQQLNLAGSMTIDLGDKIERKGCYVELTSLAGARRSVLQVRSYPEPNQESYPSIYLHAQVSADSLAELVGDSVAARFFIQPEENGPIWYSDEGQDVQLKIVSISDGKVTARVEAATLRNTDTGQEADVNGEFLAVSDW